LSSGSSRRLQLSHDKFERALRRGVRFGRAKKVSAYQRREAIDRIAAAEAVADVARTFGIDRATVYRLKP
jgi:DNA invertase Pin-like site-specific DNA recombinase